MSVVVLTVAPAAVFSAGSCALASGGISGSGGAALPYAVDQGQPSRPTPSAPGQAAPRSPTASLAHPAPTAFVQGGRRHTGRLRSGGRGAGGFRGCGKPLHRVCTTRLATVVVDVDDPAVRRDPLGDVMGVVGRRQTGPDVQELPDTLLGQVAHGPAEETPAPTPPPNSSWPQTAEPGRGSAAKAAGAGATSGPRKVCRPRHGRPTARSRRSRHRRPERHHAP